MLDLDKLQEDLHLWRMENFPDANDTEQFEGIVEELGELSHARLKMKQGIRSSLEDLLVMEQDAIGDLMIYLLGYCSYRGWGLSAVLRDTSATVMRRDWVQYPKNGITE